MLKRPLLVLTLGVLLVAVMIAGIARLFSLRLEHGDVYPPYSTLRTDPLGARGIYEALDQVSGRDVVRNYRPLERFQPGQPATLVYAGSPAKALWGPDELMHFEQLVALGGRAVFTFQPAPYKRPEPKDEKKKDGKDAGKDQDKKPDGDDTDTPKEQAQASPLSDSPEPTPGKDQAKAPTDAGKSAPPEGAKDSSKPDEEKPKDASEQKRDRRKKDKPGEGKHAPEPISFDDVAKRWGFRFEQGEGEAGAVFKGEALLKDGPSHLEHTLSWHSALSFADLQPHWRIVYESAGKPVVIERSWGDGTIVLASDSFFLSNEALRDERRPNLLAWIFGSQPLVMFDEEHHGVSEQSGVSALARKYRLQGGIAALLVVAILWLWKSAVRFVPPFVDPQSEGEVVSGRDSAEGFVSLLRRNLPPAQLMQECVAEWRKSATHSPKILARVDELVAEEQARSTRERNALRLYQEISRVVAERSPRRS